MLSILVIEDEIHMLNAIKNTLSNFGYHVQTALNGTIGLKQFYTDDFNLVITDICLPDMNGIDVLAHIRKFGEKSTPIIGISGTPEFLLKGDFDAVLVKPFKSTKLLEAVMMFC